MGIRQNDETDVESDPEDDFTENIELGAGDSVPYPAIEPFEGDIDVFSENESDFDEDDSTVRPNVEELQSSSGILFSTTPIPSARRSRNILRERPRTKATPTCEKESFSLFHTEEILSIVIRETNRKVQHLNHNNNTKIRLFNRDEISAGIAVLLRAGVDRDNMTDIEHLWNPLDSRPFYRATIGVVRFKQFLRCLRFDNILTRQQRQMTDRLAAIRDVWELFISTLRRHYVPEENITVDEQLVGYRGKVPGRTYIPSKPKKYGVKIFWACEAASGFVLNGIIYTGRQPGQAVEHELGKNVVLELLRPYFRSGRNVVTDNFFTSYNLAKELASHDLTLLGTIRKHRREIPAFLKDTRSLPEYSSRFVFQHDDAITLVAYIPRRLRSVLLLSSSHSSPEVDESNEKRKPQIINDYNANKGGVDTFDENVEEYSCRRKTSRWPLLIYFNILDAAAYDAFILMQKNGYR